MHAHSDNQALVVAVVCALASVVGCANTQPDVVAVRETARPDGSFAPPVIRPCRAGNYSGVFNSRSGADAGQVSVLNGVMSFSLVKVMSGELDYKVSSGATLDGKSIIGNETFTAGIDSDNSGCYEGHFHVTLVDGLFNLAPGAQPYSFVGKVQGDYVKSASSGDEAFFGSWQAFPADAPDGSSPILQGDWSAIWTGPN